jgi:hypothetical protein
MLGKQQRAAVTFKTGPMDKFLKFKKQKIDMEEEKIEL